MRYRKQQLKGSKRTQLCDPCISSIQPGSALSAPAALGDDMKNRKHGDSYIIELCLIVIGCGWFFGVAYWVLKLKGVIP